MGDAAADLARAAEHAVGELVGGLAGADMRWLALGVLLHLGNQLARGLGWAGVIAIACADVPRRRRDAVLAWVAGAGAGGVLSARGGDAVRLLLLRPRMPGTGVGVLAGTLVAEAAGEAAVGVVLVAIAVATGLWALPALPGPLVMIAAAVAVTGLILLARRSAAARSVARGAGALRSPGRYARAVLPWQIASRAARAVAIACFLAAFGLPTTVTTVLLVMLAQSGGRVVPVAPASVGAGAAILAAGFGSATGADVTGGQVVAFFVGTSALLTAVGIATALATAAAALYEPGASLSASQLRIAWRTLRLGSRATP